MTAEFTASDFQRETNVSRETLERLEVYVALLTKWQKAINLISSRTLADVWFRHLFDSAQLLDLAPATSRNWFDVGSGAGFPGLVLSILGARHVFLLEKDSRKCAFLREANRVTEAGANIVEGKLEEIAALVPASRTIPVPHVITARAVAPLDQLLSMVEPLCAPETICLFPKGQDVGRELTAVAKYPNIRVDKLPSRTAPGAAILRIKGLANGT
ncbi:MAG: 16S rRNA (guanine(527)-N(7))-methyltransferase RsmG [Alphaproteobacteria bacterium]|nr:16S rRNA (guanine(527)-N(7))-methyltransferase RsmG [Alphaproteobacteria bacterium]